MAEQKPEQPIQRMEVERAGDTHHRRRTTKIPANGFDYVRASLFRLLHICTLILGYSTSKGASSVKDVFESASTVFALNKSADEFCAAIIAVAPVSTGLI